MGHPLFSFTHIHTYTHVDTLLNEHSLKKSPAYWKNSSFSVLNYFKITKRKETERGKENNQVQWHVATLEFFQEIEIKQQLCLWWLTTSMYEKERIETDECHGAYII
jgi:hypothetical protein